jgi:hypothetical protein
MRDVIEAGKQVPLPSRRAGSRAVGQGAEAVASPRPSGLVERGRF